MEVKVMFFLLIISYSEIECLRTGFIRNVSLTGARGFKINAISCDECACFLSKNITYISFNCYILNTSCEFFSSYNLTINYQMKDITSNIFYFIELPPISQMTVLSTNTIGIQNAGTILPSITVEKTSTTTSTSTLAASTAAPSTTTTTTSTASATSITSTSTSTTSTAASTSTSTAVLTTTTKSTTSTTSITTTSTTSTASTTTSIVASATTTTSTASTTSITSTSTSTSTTTTKSTTSTTSITTTSTTSTASTTTSTAAPSTTTTTTSTASTTSITSTSTSTTSTAASTTTTKSTTSTTSITTTSTTTTKASTTTTTSVFDPCPYTVAGRCNSTLGSDSFSLKQPIDVYINRNGTNLYVGDYGNSRVQIFQLPSKSATTYSTTVNGPLGIYYDDDRSIMYVSQYTPYKLSKWPSGQTVPASGTTACNATGGWNSMAYGIVGDRQGTFYVSHNSCNTIVKWTLNATQPVLIAGTGTTGSTSQKLSSPRHMYLDEVNDFIYVADTSNHRIQRYSVKGNGTGVTVAGGNGQGKASNQLDSPTGVYVSKKDGSVYISDQNNNRIQKWTVNSTSGVTVAGNSNGTLGKGPFTLDHPFAVILDPAETYIYIADYNNHRVQRYPVV